MIKHIVMFKFLHSAEGRTKQENLDLAASMLRNLQGKIPSLHSSELHYNDKTAAKTNYDLILICNFKNWEGLKEYLVHTEHIAVGEFIKRVRRSRACVDYEY